MTNDNILIPRRKYGAVFAALAIFLLADYLFKGVLYIGYWCNTLDVLAYYERFAIALFICAAIFLRAPYLCAEERVLFLYAAWVCITRLLNGDLRLMSDYDYFIKSVVMCSAFTGVGLVLTEKGRRAFINAASFIYCAVMLFFAVLGIYAVVRGIVIDLPFEITVGISKERGTNFIEISNIIRTVSGMWFCIAACLTLYLMFAYKNRVFRVFAGVCAFIFYCAVALSFGRTAMLAMCAAVAMLGMLLVLRRLAGKSVRVKAVALAVTAAVLLLASYKGYGLVQAAFSRLAAVCTVESVQTEPFAPAEDAEPAAEAAADSNGTEQPAFVENRSLFDLTGRTDIWRYGFITLKNDPTVLLRGGLVDDYMRASNALNPATEYKQHMHNFLLDSLMLTGLVGLVLLAVFAVLLVVRMVRLFFATDAQVGFEKKLLTLPLAAILLENTMEAVIFRYTDPISICFFLVAGVFLAYSYELLPEKKLHLSKT